MFALGNLKLSSRLILAPLAGISDLSFRCLNRKFGCELAFVEMINVRSLSYKSRKTQKMLSTLPNEKPLGIQILGCEPEFILRGLDILKSYKFDILDFNAACPHKKVVNRGEGAGLLKEPKKLNKLLKLIVKNSTVPVTVKVRTCWDENSAKTKDIALACQDAGISGLFIHGRSRAQMYSGKVDYPAIREVKRVLTIPVVASGDILSAQLAKKMFDETGVDALAIARGALGNPWIFREINEFLDKGVLLERPDINQLYQVMTEHLGLCVDFHGERVGVVIFRRFFCWYTRNLRAVKPLRQDACSAKTKLQMSGVIRKLYESAQKQHVTVC